MNGWHRLWVVASALWVAGCIWALNDWYRIDRERTMALMVLGPVAAYCLGLGVAWVIRGFRR